MLHSCSINLEIDTGQGIQIFQVSNMKAKLNLLKVLPFLGGREGTKKCISNGNLMKLLII